MYDDGKKQDVPVAFAIAVLLHLLGINVDIAALGKEARQLFCRRDAAISETLVVTFAVLVRASHCYRASC